MGDRWPDGIPRTPPRLCHACGYLTNAAACMTSPETPRPGDVSICVNCGTLAIFAQDLTLRALTAAERAEPQLEELARRARRTAYRTMTGTDLGHRGGRA